MVDYETFLEAKRQQGSAAGFEPVIMPDFLFDFQKHLLDWAIRQGRAAIFADCGLGKTPMQLVWAENVVRKTNGNVLILTPLAVSAQTLREAHKFDIDAAISRDGQVHRGITITNYQRLHYFDASKFSGVVCDESSILKSFDGATKQAITIFMRKVPYRLLCTATAAPNDYIEIGTSSEALGYLGHMDMLNRFFINKNKTSDTKGKWSGFGASRARTGPGWRFKGHADLPFWRWVCSWARACRRPSDLGFDDDGFILPPLNEQQHVVTARSLPEGMLFSLPAITLAEQREERRRTIVERCERIAELVSDTGNPALAWCHLNKEGDLLAEMIPDAVQVKGADSDAAKEERLLGFADGQIRVLVTKPKIGAWGMNFQRCSHVTFFPSHSFEQYYQGVRRCWRFGQRNQVAVDVVTTDGERRVLENLRRKAGQADAMFSNIVAQMGNALAVVGDMGHAHEEEVPGWLSVNN